MPSSSSNNARTAGIAALRLKQPEKAIGLLTEVAAATPGDAEAHACLGVAYGQLGQTDRALEALRLAVQLEPHTASFQYNLGHALEMAGLPDDARGAYRMAAELDPSHRRARSALRRLEKLNAPAPSPEPAGVEMAAAETTAAAGAASDEPEPAPVAAEKAPREPSPGPARDPFAGRLTGKVNDPERWGNLLAQGVAVLIIAAVLIWGLRPFDRSRGGDSPNGPGAAVEPGSPEEGLTILAGSKDPTVRELAQRIREREADVKDLSQRTGRYRSYAATAENTAARREHLRAAEFLAREAGEAAGKLHQARYQLGDYLLRHGGKDEAISLFMQVRESDTPAAKLATKRLQELGIP